MKSMIRAVVGIAVAGVGWLTMEWILAPQPIQAAPPEVTSPTAKLANEQATEPASDAARTDQVRRRAQYQVGRADAEELERFWSDSDANIGEEVRATLESDLELRVLFFRDLAMNYNAKLAEPSDASDGAMTQSQFIALYSDFGAREAEFLLAKCRAGQMRASPFFPLPDSVLNAAHAECQLVPHYCSALGTAYLARLERGEHAELFDQRPAIGALGAKVMGQEQAAVDAMRQSVTPSER